MLQLSAQQLPPAVQTHLSQHLKDLKLDKTDLRDAVVSDSYTSQEIQHIFLAQTYQGVKVFNALLNVVVAKDGRIFVSANRFVPRIAQKITGQSLTFSPETALQKAATHLGLTISEPISRISEEKSPIAGNLSQKVLLSNAGISQEQIPAELVWQKQEDGSVSLCWNLLIHEKTRANWWEVRVATTTGEVLEKNNWVAQCDFSVCSEQLAVNSEQSAVSSEKLAVRSENCEEDGIEGTQATLATNDFNVYDLPLESPNFGNRTVVNSPWNKAGAGNNATTLQWLNDGTTTYTITRGNNVWAKEDVAGDNETTVGASASSPSSDFNFPLTLGTAAATYQNAAITNLFYWNNLMHDITYQYGFDEPSGNFQRSNLNRGGNGNDYVNADAQDGSGTNNANFSTPNDGTKPRMQMFLWSGSVSLVINSPAGVAGAYPAGSANFNPTTPPSVTGNLAIANPARGCTALTNGAQVTGKIAVIDRGGCTFVIKVKNAQNAGAIGVIIADSIAAGGPPAMGGTDNTITILSCSITQADGVTLKTAMQAGTVNGTINADASVLLDGDLDNGVVAHEYGHGVSNRLTGGPSNSSCLGNAEQMGEGWSDYLALMVTTNWATAQANDVRGIGTYVAGQAPAGGGIREYPYSYDMNISPYNYNYARNNTEVHALGSAWTAMLWDMTWNIIGITPTDPDIYGGAGGNNIAFQLVMEGMKLQPCSPGFVDGRDAILLADEILYNNAHRCAIWAAFARRGLGYTANQGSSTDASDGSQAFDVPQGVTLTLTPDVNAVNQGSTINYVLKTQCECGENNNLNLTATLPSELDYVASSGGNYNSGTGIVSYPAFNLSSGQFRTDSLKALVNNSFTMPSIYFNDNVENGGSNWAAVHISGTTVNFAIDTANAHTPTHAWHIADEVTPSENTLKMVTPVMVTPGSFLSFWHYHKAETNYDGGVVEISTNNGTSWQDLGQYMTQNGYTGIIDPVTDNVLINKPAFTGEQPLRKTSINLATFSGQNVLIRFRFATDTQNGTMTDATGWFIDDIQFAANDTCLYVTATVANATVGDSDDNCIGLDATIVVPNAVQNPLSAGISVYPNPTHSELFIDLPANVQTGKIRLYNEMGQLIHIQSIATHGKQIVPLQSYPQGVYLLEIFDGKNVLHERVVKE